MDTMTSMDRVMASLSHKEPDRVPVFLLLTMHGAKELGMSIKDYFSDAKNVIEGQKIIHAKYRNDCLNPFFYAATEIQAWGGDAIFIDDGPPNAGAPIIRTTEDIDDIQPPDMDHPILRMGLEAIEGLVDHADGQIPVIGTVLSPFSVPVMQMGFEGYLNLMYEDQDSFWRLMRKNEEFCVKWGNEQAKAGVTAVAYFDPLASSSMTTPDQYRLTGMKVAERVISRMDAPTATHLASGRALPIIEDIVSTGTGALGVCTLEDLAELKRVCKGRLSLLGNLNGIEMRRWTAQQAEEKVKDCIMKAGPGGGFILSDNHGEIPFQVSDEVLLAIRDAVDKWGEYPLDWIV